MTRIGAMSPEDTEFVLSICRQISRSGILKSDRIAPTRERSRQVFVYNDSGEEIPAFAVMQVTDTADYTSIGINYLNVEKPADADGTAGPFVVNGPSAIEIGGFGIANPGPVARVQTDGDAILGAASRWSPEASSWELTPNATGQFICMGDDDQVADLGVFAINSPWIGGKWLGQNGGSAITARSSTTVSSGTVTIWKNTSGTIASASTTVTAYNFSATSIAANAYCWVEQDGFGTWWVTAEDCP